MSRLEAGVHGRLFRSPTLFEDTVQTMWTQAAVLTSPAILLAIIYVPFLDPVFRTAFSTPGDWGVMLPLILLPSLAAEANRSVLRQSGALPAGV